MVELSCGKTCMKYLLFVINFIFFCLGAAAFGIGIWGLVDKNKMNVLTKIGAENSNFDVAGLLTSAAIVLMVGGGIILVIGFLGCCGAMKQSQCLLCLYAILLVVILIIEIAAIAIAASFRSKVENELKDFLKKTINSTYEGKIDTSEEFSLGLDYAQVYFHCCGIDSYKDFEYAVKWNRTSPDGKIMVIPPTCCKLDDDDAYLKDQKYEPKDKKCPTGPTDDNSYQKEVLLLTVASTPVDILGATGVTTGPCWDSIEKYLKDRISIVIGIAAGIVALEVFCLIFACCIISAIRKGD